MVVWRLARVVQVVDSWIFITETMEILCIICFWGNHSNLFDALVMASVFTDKVVYSRIFLFVHFARWFYGEKISQMIFMDR